MVAVRNEYDELAADYNNLEADRDNTREETLIQKEALAEKQGVVNYLQGQVADVTAENDALRRLQEQVAADPPIVNPPANNADNRDNERPEQEVSPAPSTDSTRVGKRRLKLQDPPVLTDGKDSVPVEHWLAKMDGKMTANDDLYDTPARRMVYVMNCVGGTAFSHVEPRSGKNATKPWKDLEEMLACLERVFGDSNRRENAETEFRALRQGGKDFNTFWAEFQRLAIELDRNDATLISDLTSKLSYEMQRQLNTGDKRCDGAER